MKLNDSTFSYKNNRNSLWRFQAQWDVFPTVIVVETFVHLWSDVFFLCIHFVFMVPLYELIIAVYLFNMTGLKAFFIKG